MTEPRAVHGVSSLDRAHGLRLMGQTGPALQRASSLLASSPDDVGPAYLVARLLMDDKRTQVVPRVAAALLERFVRRGDLGSACLCVQLTQESGGDARAALGQVAQAFGAGSPRVGDGAPPPPPLPSSADVSDSFASLEGDALYAAAERVLERFLQTGDPVPADAKLPKLPLFGELAPPVLAKLLGVMQVRELAPGQFAVKQGEDGREAFLLVRGVLNVLRQDGPDSQLLAVLGPGALFGEMALVSQAPRAASVAAVEPAQLLVANRVHLEALAKRDPTIGRELGRFCRQRMLANLIRHSRILSSVEPAKRPELVAHFTTQTFQPGEVLVRQGEESACLFLIATGTVEVRSVDAEGDRVVLAQLGPGDVVGEISLVLRRPAVADVVAVHATVALRLTQAQFQAAIHAYPGLLQQLYDVAIQRESETRSVVARPALDVSDNVLL